MKKLLAFLVCFIGFFSIAQTTTITQLLQKTLQKENEVRQMLRAEADSVGNEIGYP